MGILERIKEIEAEMARTQKNKATGCVAFSAPSNYYIVGLLLIAAYCLFFSSLVKFTVLGHFI